MCRNAFCCEGLESSEHFEYKLTKYLEIVADPLNSCLQLEVKYGKNWKLYC